MTSRLGLFFETTPTTTAVSDCTVKCVEQGTQYAEHMQTWGLSLEGDAAKDVFSNLQNLKSVRKDS